MLRDFSPEYYRSNEYERLQIRQDEKLFRVAKDFLSSALWAIATVGISVLSLGWFISRFVIYLLK